MYGPRKSTVARFRYDLEAVFWQELVAVTLTMQRSLLDACLAVVRHWATIQGADER